MGYPCDKVELLALVGEYVNTTGLKNRFKNVISGEEWYRSFMKRHPTLSLKKPEHLQKLKKDARKSEIIYDFYNKLKICIEENVLNLPNMYSFVFNA